MRIPGILLALLLATTAFAADITGKWKATVESPNGTMDLVFEFKNAGDKITGTSTSPMGEAPMSDVKLDGDKISFNVEVGDMKIVHKGTVSGDEMKLKVEIGDQTMDMTAKKSGS